jgi:hypothetical protein
MLDTNQYKNNSAIGFPQADGQITQETFDWIKKCSNLDLVLSGHIHIQDISSYKKDADKMYDIATGSLAVYPHQYGILKYSAEDGTLRYSTSKLDFEGYSKEIGKVDKNINNFSEYAKEFFGKLAYDMAYKELIKEKKYSKDEINPMLKL